MGAAPASAQLRPVPLSALRWPSLASLAAATAVFVFVIIVLGATTARRVRLHSPLIPILVAAAAPGAVGVVMGAGVGALAIRLSTTHPGIVAGLLTAHIFFARLSRARIAAALVGTTLFLVLLLLFRLCLLAFIRHNVSPLYRDRLNLLSGDAFIPDEVSRDSTRPRFVPLAAHDETRRVRSLDSFPPPPVRRHVAGTITSVAIHREAQTTQNP